MIRIIKMIPMIGGAMIAVPYPIMGIYKSHNITVRSNAFQLSTSITFAEALFSLYSTNSSTA
jgi:hypothetical protein